MTKFALNLGWCKFPDFCNMLELLKAPQLAQNGIHKDFLLNHLQRALAKPSGLGIGLKSYTVNKEKQGTENQTNFKLNRVYPHIQFAFK